ncbi:WD40-repeat-containing domain protein [Syncephalis pseudoplumigaleata]|uniref:DNA damage-binding protein CMR1 n=1 Tax=Syncephalis pseudoplumigaleata TaxID=1712513 RepID=A0A4P9Z1R1_9FUNG|nr:WD40-repeat-containing domain protein [Syncephalis pseudoplumigaleata]|eukprot:RKP26278.1 WD40-repeat-containing domain protein [Syncephalis pseudoplumigaleata]
MAANAGLSEYELARLENIRRNQEVLASLNLPALATPPPSSAEKRKAGTVRRPSTVKKKRDTKEREPVRQSARLRGKPPTLTKSMLALASPSTAEVKPQVQLRKRIEDDIDLALAADVAGLGPQGKVDEETARDVAEVRETFSKLRILHEEDGTVKVTPERIYCTAFHPSQQLLVAAGDKAGTLGFWDATRSPADDSDVASEEREDKPDPVYTYTAHTGTLASMKYTPDGGRLFTSGYDGAIRYLDMTAQKFMEAYYYEFTADSDDPRELLIGSLDIDPTHSDVGRGTSLYPLLEKKIGCVSVNPHSARTHYIATSSLDRTLRIWDARKMATAADPTQLEPVTEFAHGKSVTAAYWSPDGQRLVSSSYDDTLRVFDIGDTAAPSLASPIKIRHNCQTGRWVTMLRAGWIRHEPTHPTFLIGNMRRSVDLFSAMTGELIWTLTAPDMLTAVPAVAAAHPLRHAIVGGTASGRMLIWSIA